MEVKELGHVVLYVQDLERSAAFYRDVLGFGRCGVTGRGASPPPPSPPVAPTTS